MMRNALVAGFGTLLLLSGIATPAAHASGHIADQLARSADNPTNEEVFEAQERAKFGFDDSIAAVRSAGYIPDASDNALGIPLTSTEKLQLASREELTSRVDSLYSAVASNTTFAGLWIAQSDYGYIHLLFTSTQSPVLISKLRGLLPDPNELVIEYVSNASAELNAVASQITGDIRKWQAEGITLAQVGVDVKSNTVSVVVATDAPSTAEMQISSTYSGEPITLSRGGVGVVTTNRNITSGPPYGGEFLSSGNPYCTSGYAEMTNANGTYLVTAGHCFPLHNNVFQGLVGSSTSVGSVRTNSFNNSGNNTYCDCEAVGPLTSSQVSHWVLLGNNDKYSYTSTPASYSTGQMICHSGAVTAEETNHLSCGTITYPSTTLTEAANNVVQDYVLDGVVDNCSVIDGDSGAPYGDGGNFMGIQAVGINKSQNQPYTGHTVYDDAGFSKSIHMNGSITVSPSFS